MRDVKHECGILTLPSIHAAEFAAFKLRETLRNGDPFPTGGKEPRLHGRSSNGSRKVSLGGLKSEASASRKGTKSIAFADMEQDYTTARQPGQLGCPFGKKPTETVLSRPNSVSKHNLPTPRSSGSGLDILNNRTQRSSFNDPIRPLVSNGQIPVDDESDVDSNGPACPIRFLDQHSPEDIAKYFEEHKSQLPRSHAACIKRFEMNGDSMKELDAKYGNMATMLQGLGQKHQPMLPEAPASEAAYQDTDAKAAKKIKNWARAVSEEPRGGQIGHLDPAGDLKARTDVEEQERVSRFDRPLKEIRVGESPSRPWGVPIPSKYLDKQVDAASDVAEAAAERSISVEIDEKSPHAEKDMGVRATPAAKGKCPFGHGAGATIRPSENIPAEQMKSMPAAVDEPTLRPKEASKSAPRQAADATDTRTKIVNHSLAVVADPTVLGSVSLVNHGMLVLGYPPADIPEIYRMQQNHHPAKT